MRLRELQKVVEAYEETKKSAIKLTEELSTKSSVLKVAEVRTVIKMHKSGEIPDTKLGEKYKKYLASKEVPEKKVKKTQVKKPVVKPTPKKRVGIQDYVTYDHNPYGAL